MTTLLAGWVLTGHALATPLVHLVPQARDVARGSQHLPIPDVPVPNPWFVLEPYQETMTAADFRALLEKIYDPFGGTTGLIDITDSEAVFYPEANEREIPDYVLRFAPEGTESWARTPRAFRLPEEFRAIPKLPGKPLKGLRVAVDPGHIGGEWANMEGRSVKFRKGRIQEGDLVMEVARILKKRLENLGAEVYLVRDRAEPVTPLRPEDLVDEAKAILMSRATLQSAKDALAKADGLHPKTSLDRKVRNFAELLFFRAEEIAARARKINSHFEPDVSLALHLNATNGSGSGRLTPKNRNVFFVHGAYTKEEAQSDQQRERMIEKLVEGSLPVEIELADAVARSFEERTGSPPVLYGDSANTRRMLQHNMFVVARNLAANRLIDGPVVFCEPYFMNQRDTVVRLLEGDYDGTRTFNKKEFPSIFQEYAGALVDGILEVYGPPRDPRLDLVAETHADKPDADSGHADHPPKDKPASDDKAKDKPVPIGPQAPG